MSALDTEPSAVFVSGGMNLREWLEANPDCTMADIMRDTGLGYETLRALKRGRAAAYRTAKILSQYTDGEISIDALCDPEGEVA